MTKTYPLKHRSELPFKDNQQVGGEGPEVHRRGCNHSIDNRKQRSSRAESTISKNLGETA